MLECSNVVADVTPKGGYLTYKLGRKTYRFEASQTELGVVE